MQEMRKKEEADERVVVGVSLPDVILASLGDDDVAKKEKEEVHDEKPAAEKQQEEVVLRMTKEEEEEEQQRSSPTIHMLSPMRPASSHGRLEVGN